MPYGFNITNDNGYTQVDQNYSNLALIQKGTVTVNTLLDGNYTTTITFTGRVSPVLAIRPPLNGTVGIDYYASSTDPTSRTYRFWSSSIITVEYWLFDSNAAMPTSGYGINVYKANGSGAWSSEWKTLRISDYRAISNSYQTTIDDPVISPAPTPFSVGTPANFAVVIGDSRIWIDPIMYDGYARRYGDAITRSSSGYSVGVAPRWSSLEWYYWDMLQSGGSGMFLVDVSNY